MTTTTKARASAPRLPRGRFGRVELTAAQRYAVDRFIFAHLLRPQAPPVNGHYLPGLSKELYFESYQQWARGGHAWMPLEQGGTGIMAALCWYHHIHRPGSREWRPSIIIAALVQAAEAWCATTAAVAS